LGQKYLAKSDAGLSFVGRLIGAEFVANGYIRVTATAFAPDEAAEKIAEDFCEW